MNAGVKLFSFCVGSKRHCCVSMDVGCWVLGGDGGGCAADDGGCVGGDVGNGWNSGALGDKTFSGTSFPSISFSFGVDSVFCFLDSVTSLLIISRTCVSYSGYVLTSSSMAVCMSNLIVFGVVVIASVSHTCFRCSCLTALPLSRLIRGGMVLISKTARYAGVKVEKSKLNVNPS